jgi:hypothetical protein
MQRARPLRTQNLVLTSRKPTYLQQINVRVPAGSFFPDFKRTPMICSFKSTDEIRASSLGFGDSSGMSATTVGNGRRAPTIEVASVRGTPKKPEVNKGQGTK